MPGIVSGEYDSSAVKSCRSRAGTGQFAGYLRREEKAHRHLRLARA